MTSSGGGRERLRRIAALAASADVARAYTLAAFGAVFGAFAITRTASTATYTTIVFCLCVLGIGILIARRAEFSLLRLVPSTLVLFLAWALLSSLWTTDRTATALGWLSNAGLAVIAIVIAHVRDALQTARALGDVLRVVLAVSLGMEILSGILLDLPITFLGIQGNIAEGGPVQGIFGTRNQLGFAVVLALVTFVIEWRTASVRNGLALFSVVLAGTLGILSGSPTVLVVAVAVAIVTAALALVRHTPKRMRTAVQWGLAGLTAFVALFLYFGRQGVIRFLGAGADLSLRTDLWNTLPQFVQVRPITGWGWFGPWSDRDFPFVSINAILSEQHQSALNAFYDVLLQLGWFGLVLFAGLCGFALVRSWLVASELRSVVYAWMPLVLVALLVDSLFESFTLVGFGWLTLVLIVARAGLSRSWRERIGAGFEEQDAEGPTSANR